ncbi:glutathione S-transferase 1-like [Thrips palmi]|uniref:Glutathione S-transferase 1-like n=1 Tax=Thrips palmi TaxID=161013 RepID=A0A6P9A162_THRPL|nr:glutathione S-transferase 1-like [Thrips palmi]XP_034250626.1 glutathione S-transferase 1-like [Thrips palmi]
MVLTLYGTGPSPPARAVRLACKAMGIEYDFVVVDVLGGDLKKPEYLKINPHHTVPFIKDGDFVLWDSHAIVAYLGDKTGNDSWYPKDIKQRATVHQRLHFDNGILFTRFKDAVAPVFYGNAVEIPKKKVQAMQEAVDLVEPIIHEGGWLAGSRPTIADCCCATSVSIIATVFPEITLPPKVVAWLRRCEEELPGYDEINNPTYSKNIADALAARMGKK